MESKDGNRKRSGGGNDRLNKKPKIPQWDQGMLCQSKQYKYFLTKYIIIYIFQKFAGFVYRAQM